MCVCYVWFSHHYEQASVTSLPVMRLKSSSSPFFVDDAPSFQIKICLSGGGGCVKSLGRAAQASNTTVSSQVECSVKSAFIHLHYLALRTIHRGSLVTICRAEQWPLYLVTLRPRKGWEDKPELGETQLFLYQFYDKETGSQRSQPICPKPC